jgi:adenine specific DNA methylase Mod
VLEGGQSKDDEKRKEIFFNEVLAKDEINRLLNKKVITSAKKKWALLSGSLSSNLISSGSNFSALCLTFCLSNSPSASVN